MFLREGQSLVARFKLEAAASLNCRVADFAVNENDLWDKENDYESRLRK